jgi:hypothetical protein
MHYVDCREAFDRYQIIIMDFKIIGDWKIVASTLFALEILCGRILFVMNLAFLLRIEDVSCLKRRNAKLLTSFH